jgi:3-oxoadipate enol-lactonase
MKIGVRGIEMRYELSGKKDAPVVMLSHSLGSNVDMWNPQMAALEPHYRVLRYDTRGHGATDAPPGSYTLEQLGDDAIGLLDTLSIDAVHWVGQSLGGMIGQCLALNHAHRLHSLVVCDTAAIIPKEAQPVWQERINTVREKGMEALVQSTLEGWFTSSYLEQNPPAVEQIRKQFLATPVAGYIGCSEAIRRLNYLDRLHKIKTPTLIIVGENDPRTPVAAAQAIHERIRGSRMVVLPSASHLSNVEQAKAYSNTLMEFLRGVSS